MMSIKWDLTFKNLNVMTNDPHGYGVVSFQNNGKMPMLPLIMSKQEAMGSWPMHLRQR